MNEPTNTCEDCGQSFYYDPKCHRCPGDWEAIAPPMQALPTTTWVEECMAKQYGKA